MTYTIKLNEWLKSKKDVRELPSYSFKKQLEQLDNIGTGIGFLIMTNKAELYTTTQNDIQETEEIISIPIIKIKGEWITFKDENIRDVIAGIINMLVPEEKE